MKHGKYAPMDRFWAPLFSGNRLFVQHINNSVSGCAFEIVLLGLYESQQPLGQISPHEI